jgi:uncharacterized protein
MFISGWKPRPVAIPVTSGNIVIAFSSWNDTTSRMAAFECDRCGKCCVSLGPLITIERQLNDRDYYCCCKIDNAIFLAHVNPAYGEEIAEEFADGGSVHPANANNSCRFLRKDRQGDRTTCAIYQTRPKVCREFRCYRMLIRNREGAVCGKVIGKNTIRTDDAALEHLWNAQVTAIAYGNPFAWTKDVAGVLTDHGYCVDPVE